MSVSVKHDPELHINPRSLQSVLYDKQLIAQLARQLVASQVEAHIDIGHDCSSEYPTHLFAADMIKNAKVTTEDYVEDLLTEFRGELYDAIRSVEIDVKTTTFSAEGFEDADVLVK